MFILLIGLIGWWSNDDNQVLSLTFAFIFRKCYSQPPSQKY